MASFAPIRGTRAQIQVTPIVDGQFLVETDQGVDNKIYMDEGSTRTIVGGNTVTGVLPELYIYSETGSTVTVEDEGGTLIPTSQVGTDHWICEVPDYGVYTVYSLLDGETTTQSINVTDCMIYTIDDSHFHCNIVVTYPSGVGASCQISGGGETYSAPSLNPPDTSYKFVVHGKNTTYTITTNVDGIIKTETITTGTVLDQTYNVTMPYARVNLTVEMPPITGNLTCTDGTTTITRIATPSMSLYLDLGTWTISGSDGIDTYDTEVIVSDLTVTYEADLSSAPDGATVLPTDDIQTWLKCAKIRNKTSYTTLDDVLNDNETLQKLISNENACNYMVRSKGWIKRDALVPTMTSDNTPEGEVFYTTTSSAGYSPWKVFDNDDSTLGGGILYSVNNSWIGYEFTSPKIVNHLRMYGVNTVNSFAFKVQGANSQSDTFVDLSNTINYTAGDTLEINFDNNTAYKCYRIFLVSMVSGSAVTLNTIQFYSPIGITDDEIAMRLIGENNYASNTLLVDSDWSEALASSDYSSLVFNIKVPLMTSNTTPSGEASCSSYLSSQDIWNAYRAFHYDPMNEYGDGRGWLAPSGATNPWVQYDFGQEVNIYEWLLTSQNGDASYNPVTFVLHGSTDNFNSSDDTLGTITAVRDNYATIHYANVNNGTAYRYYRVVQQGTNNTYAAGIRCQFLGRNDVDQTVYYIYSAADDTIIASPQGGGAAITITTNNDGYGTIAKSNLPNGTYTFVSSKAKDPDNLNNNYSDTIAINSNNVIEIALMPQNVIYWWGYLSIICEDATAANGWSLSGYTFSAPTHNLNNVTCTGASGTIQGLATKIKINCKNGLNQISIVDARGANNNVYGDLYGVDTKTVVTTQCRITTAGFQKVVNSNLQTTKYLLTESDNAGRLIDIYALLYEYV